MFNPSEHVSSYRNDRCHDLPLVILFSPLSHLIHLSSQCSTGPSFSSSECLPLSAHQLSSPVALICLWPPINSAHRHPSPFTQVQYQIVLCHLYESLQRFPDWFPSVTDLPALSRWLTLPSAPDNVLSSLCPRPACSVSVPVSDPAFRPRQRILPALCLISLNCL